MVHINLLPVRQIKKKLAARRELTILFACFLLLLGVLGGIVYFQSAAMDRLQADISRLTKEKQRHARTLKLIKQLEKDKAVIEKQIAIIKQLKKSSSLTVHILDEIANCTPADRMWLTSLSQSGTNLSISGMALDNRTIANYMEELKKSPYITSVNLASTSLKTYAGRNLKAFSLSCTITANTEKKEKTASEKK
jgi:type IV pilus assembly protein PilN